MTEAMINPKTLKELEKYIEEGWLYIRAKPLKFATNPSVHPAGTKVVWHVGHEVRNGDDWLTAHNESHDLDTAITDCLKHWRMKNGSKANQGNQGNRSGKGRTPVVPGGKGQGGKGRRVGIRIKG